MEPWLRLLWEDFGQKFRWLNDLVRGNKRNPQSRSQGFGVVKRKHIIGAFSIELFSFYGINVREDQVDRFLSKVIKGSAGFNDVSEKGMIFRSLPVLFLRYTLGVCKGNCCGSSSRNRYTQTEPSEDWDTPHLSVQMNWCTIPYGFSLLRRLLSDFFLSVLLLL